MCWRIDTNTPLKKGDMIKCKTCGKKHRVKYSTRDGVETNEVLITSCPKSKTTTLVGLDGYMIEKVTGVPPIVRIDDMIKRLQDIKNKHGNIPVKYAYKGPDASCNIDVKDIVVEVSHNPKQTIAVIK